MQLLTRLYANLPIGLKLASGFAILIVLSVALGLIGIGALDTYGDSATNAAKTSAIERAILAARTEEKNLLLRGDTGFAEKAQLSLETAEKTATKLADSAGPADPRQTELLAAIIEGTRRYSDLLTEVSEVLAQTENAREQLTLNGRILEAQMNAEDRLYLASAIFKQMRRDERAYLQTGNPDALTQFNNRLERAQASIRSSSLNQDEKDKVNELFDAYASSFLAFAEHTKLTDILEQEMVTTARQSLEASNTLQQQQVTAMRGERQQARLIMAASTVTIILLGLLMAWLLTRLITRPIREAVITAQRVARGNCVPTFIAITTMRRGNY
ncbi:hypothetical protein [Marinobacter sp. NP-4(2019)]|uniref:hypothetical protein n=1 Tax=Marinobacter sp. NP-4(2019) TaxID=2488665 RepID=UPI001D1987A6|nr:hypothetical protein [Marinobacter sp. NP-4(2019)]